MTVTEPASGAIARSKTSDPVRESRAERTSLPRQYGSDDRDGALEDKDRSGASVHTVKCSSEADAGSLTT